MGNVIDLLSPPYLLIASRRGLWRTTLLLGLLVVIYLLARLPNLLSLPIFNDEANYQWRGLTFPASLEDSIAAGKLVQDLLLAILVRMPGDPLLLSRLSSVFFGLGTLVAILMIGRVLQRPDVGALAGLFYVSAPMAVLHERMGIPDSLLTCVATFLLLASIYFVRAPVPTQRQALVIGILLGIALTVKVYGLFLFSVPIMAVLWLSATWDERWRRLSMLRIALIVVLLWLAVFIFLRYGFFERHKMTFTTLEQRFDVLLTYVQLFGLVLLTYLPGSLLIPLGILVVLRPTLDSAWRTAMMLLSSSFIFVIIFLVVGTRIFPRYFMPIWPAVLIACAIGFTEVWQRSGRRQWITRSICVAAVGATVIWNSYFTIHLMLTPHTAPLVAPDRRGYIENWTAGYNLPAMMVLVEQEATKHDGIVIINHNRDRLIRTAAFLHFYDNPKIKFENIEMTSDSAEEQIQEHSKEQPTYILLDGEGYDLLHIPQRFPQARIVGFFEHPTGTMGFYLLRYESSHP